jgi:hypothetical protein
MCCSGGCPRDARFSAEPAIAFPDWATQSIDVSRAYGHRRPSEPPAAPVLCGEDLFCELSCVPVTGRFAVNFMSAGRGQVRGSQPTPAQQSNTDQQMSFRNRWSSSTSSRIASGSWSRCHRHSSRPAVSLSSFGAAARAALIA